jgi:hypothetical protein
MDTGIKSRYDIYRVQLPIPSFLLIGLQYDYPPVDQHAR